MSVNFSVNNNAQAQSILQNLNNVQNSLNNEYSALSTGNSVNSASDNPAGYAISQQMTAQVNGLNQATQNAQNGISMIQTATGAMNQVETIMQTMSSLATEASTAGMSYSDRANLQLEMNSLAQQVNSTTNQTQYNGINLLTGQFANGATGGSTLSVQAGANKGQSLSFNIAATDVTSLGIAGTSAAGITLASTSINAVSSTGTNGASFSTTAQNFVTSTGNAVTFGSNTLFQNGQQFEIAITASLSATSSGVSVTSESLQLMTANGTDIGGALTISSATANSGGTVTLGDSATNSTLQINLAGSAGFSISASSTGTFSGVIGFTATGGTSAQAGSQLNGWQASSSVSGLNIMNQSSAQSAITSIHNALNQLSSEQASLGAVQNQLNYTVSDLQNSSQNLQNAKSTITNTNMAAEYTQFSQNQILDQVGQSMLAQADQQPASILKLLQ